MELNVLSETQYLEYLYKVEDLIVKGVFARKIRTEVVTIA